MTRYELLLFLHIAAAVTWLGGGLAIQLLAIKADRSSDPLDVRRIAEQAEWLAPRLFIPASLATFILGVLLVLDGPWHFDQLWIDLGLIGYAASFVTGIAYISPEAARVARVVEERGPTDPEVSRRVARIFFVSRVELAVLYLVVADMVIKPTADDGWTLVAGAVGLALAAFLSFRSFRRADVGPPAPAIE